MADQDPPFDSSSDVNIRITKPRVSLDFNTVFGLLLTFGVISLGIMIGQSDANFFNLPSFLIVIIGTITVTSISYTWEEVTSAGKIIGQSVFRKVQSPKVMASQLLDMAVLAKTKGLLALAGVDGELRKDKHLQQAAQIVTDGYSASDVENVLAHELDALVQRHRRSASILRRGSEVAPAMGLIGTLIGLVQMLADLQNPETIGPSMAVALLTTFYGAILGTAVLAPMAAKLERNSNDEAMIRTLVLIAMSSISRQDNPRRLEMMLNSELPPQERIRYFD